MTRVDFYVLNSGDVSQCTRFACRLTEKAFADGLRIFIHAPTAEEQRQLDDALWTFRQGSFIPHAISKMGETQIEPVLIGEEPVADAKFDVYVNLGGRFPNRHDRYARIAEIVGGDTTSSKEAARQRFRAYRNAGLEIFSHNVDNQGSQNYV